ncbi:MAG: tetratricopeptide repeat protein [Cyclobacteriaceae bacterium]|nr:tetratricopeptide repeat protein [Cyclobacteriaceae bacterium]
MRCFFFLLLLASFTGLAQPALDRGKSLYGEKRLEAAKEQFQQIDEDSPDYAAARYYLGRIAFEEKKFDDAADFFEEATEAKGGNQSEYFTWLGDTYGTIAQDANVIRQGMLAPKMKSAWEKAIALDAKNLNARFSLISFYTQAPSFMGGSMDKAKEMARQIMAISPAQGHRSMGNLYLREKNIPAAEKEYLEMARIEPALLPVLGNFYVNEKMHGKAFTLFEEQLKKNPGDMLSAYQFGKVCALSGQRLDEGEQYLLKYLSYTPKPNEPSHAGANMRLAQIYEKKGKRSEAKQKYEAALKMDGNLQEAKEGLSRVSGQ